jgi:hypothetical protein
MTTKELEEYCKWRWDSLGLENPDEAELKEQIELEETLKAFFCEHLGHEILSDMCGKPEHDFCGRCGESAPMLGYRRVAGYKDGDWRWEKIDG